MPKVYLIVTPFFPEPGFFEGPYVMDQAKAIARQSDYRVVVVKPYPFWKKADDYEIYGIKVYRCQAYTCPSNVLPNKVSDRLSARALFRKLKTLGIGPQDVAVCHTHVASLGFYALAMKKINPQCKAVVQHHGFDVFSVTDGKLADRKWHERLCIRYGTRTCNSVDLNIGVSRKTLDYVKQYPNVRLKDEYVLYNGVDTTKFFPPAEPPRNEKFTIGCIANFWPLKDQMTLIRAVERLVNEGETNIFTRFIGSGATRDLCEKYVEEHHLQPYISFEKEVMHDQLPAFYRSLDLFVLPSYWEAFGCVYTEAYACGVPFIGVKEQGISEIMPDKDKNKWLIGKNDDKKLAILIANYIKNRPIQRLEQPYEIDILVKRYINFIHE